MSLSTLYELELQPSGERIAQPVGCVLIERSAKHVLRC